MNTTSEGCSWVEYWGFIFVLLTVYTERLCCMGTEDDLHSEEILEAELYKKLVLLRYSISQLAKVSENSEKFTVLEDQFFERQ